MPTLIGRFAELAQLRSLLAESKRGSGHALFLSGEGGVGKTRLLQAAAESAEIDGWKVVTGRSYAVEAGIPYALFSDAFLGLLQGLEPGALNVLTRGGADELGALFPVLRNAAGREPLHPVADASGFKARLLWSFTQLVGKLAARQPLCIVLDNLQWADASSLELLHFLARNTSTHPIAILAAYNQTESDANPVLRTTEQSLLNLGVAQHITLGPLSQAEVFDLLTSRYDGERGAMRQFSALLYGWTRGNPFFVEETMKELISAGVVKKHADRWVGWEVETLDLPSSVRDAVNSRINRLSADARSLADVISVVGIPITFHNLSAINALTESSFAAAVDELCAQRVIAESTVNGVGLFDFVHPLVQQVLYDSLASGRRRMLHARVADALETVYGERTDSHAGELAHHYTRSGSAGSKALRYLSHAGRNALASYANREAAAFLSSALEQIELRGGTDGRDEIVRGLARALQRLGKYDDALALWTEARATALAAHDNAALADIEYRIGLACYWSGRFDEALERYDAGIRADAGDSSAVRLYLAKAICLQELARIDAAKLEMDCALEVARRTGQPSLLARAHRALLILHSWIGPREEAREHGRKAIEFAGRSGEKMLEWQANLAMAILSGLTSNANDTTRSLQRCKELEMELGSPLLPLWTAEVSLCYAFWTGEWDEALAIGEKTIAAARLYNQNTLLPRLLVWTGLIHLHRHDLDRARAYFEDAWRRSGADTATDHRIDVQCVIPAHIGLAAYHLETGNYGEAIRVGEAGARLADRLGYVAWTLNWLLPIVGEASVWARDYGRVESSTERIRRDADRLSSPIGDALADASDGLLLLMRDGNFGEAIRVMRASVAKLDASPLPDHASRLRRALAQALSDFGRPDEALKELRIAHDTFARLGAAGQLEKVRLKIKALGGRPPSKRSPKAVGTLTGREFEIARLVAVHRTNPEIGEALHISSRTVSTHLSNIFDKVGVRSRAELADYIKATFP